MQALGHVLRGFAMGAADIVPGVSGGTIALVLGIYERLVHQVRTGAASLGAVVTGRWRLARERFTEIDWAFLLPLLVGILAAIFSLAAILDHLLETQPVAMAALFFGLVAGSIAIAWRLMDTVDIARLAVIAAVAVAAFFVLGLRSTPIGAAASWYFFLSGALAICATILPGISGSFVLVMIGMYDVVLGAVNDRSVGDIALFALGATIGLAAFSTLLDRMLRDHRDTMLAALIGLMAGSMRVLWPWPDGTETARLGAPEYSDAWWAAALALAGAVAVALLARAGRRMGTPTH